MWGERRKPPRRPPGAIYDHWRFCAWLPAAKRARLQTRSDGQTRASGSALGIPPGAEVCELEEHKKFSKFQMFEMPDGRTYAQGIEEGQQTPEPPPGAKDLRIVGESKYLRQGQRLRITAAYDLPLEERRHLFRARMGSIRGES